MANSESTANSRAKPKARASTRSASVVDRLVFAHNILDLCPYGRQEEWEDSPPGWPQHPTYG